MNPYRPHLWLELEKLLLFDVLLELSSGRVPLKPVRLSSPVELLNLASLHANTPPALPKTLWGIDEKGRATVRVLVVTVTVVWFLFCLSELNLLLRRPAHVHVLCMICQDDVICVSEGPGPGSGVGFGGVWQRGVP